MTDDSETTDPIERVVADALKGAGVSYYAPAGNDISFFLAGCDTYIECKAYYSDRIVDQMKRAPNVIVIQGMGAALTFAHLIRRAMPNESQTTEEKRLRDCLQNIVEVYEMSAELFTSDEDLAASMADRARAALAGQVVQMTLPVIPEGVAWNVASSAECLLDDASACANSPTQQNVNDLLASMRIMIHRINGAFKEIGVDP